MAALVASGLNMAPSCRRALNIMHKIRPLGPAGKETHQLHDGSRPIAVAAKPATKSIYLQEAQPPLYALALLSFLFPRRHDASLA